MKKKAFELLKIAEAFGPLKKASSKEEARRKATALRALGEHMMQVRVQHGLTATDLARCLGVPICHLRDMEKGNRCYLRTHLNRLFS